MKKIRGEFMPSINNDNVVPAHFEFLAKALEGLGLSTSPHFNDGDASEEDIKKILGTLDGKDGYQLSDLKALRDQRGMSAVAFLYESFFHTSFHVFEQLEDRPSVTDRTGDNDILFALAQVISRGGILVKEIRPSWLDNMEFIRALLDCHETAYVWFPKELLAKKEVLVEIVRRDVNAISFLMKKYPEIDIFKYKEELLLAAFENKDLHVDEFIILLGTAPDVSDLLVGDFDVNKVYREFKVRHAATVLSDVSDATLAKLAILNLGILIFISDERMKRVWPIVKDALLAKGINFPDEWMTDYDTFRRNIAGTFIFFIERFRNFENLYEVWQNSLDPVDPKDKRPVVLVVGSQEDYSNYLHNNKILNSLVESGKFRVIYVESKFDNVLDEKHLRSFTDNGKRLLAKVVFLSHGEPQVLYLQDGATKEGHTIDTGDIKGGKFSHIAKYLAKDGEVFMDACLTGEGGIGNSENLVNQWATILPSTMKISGYLSPVYSYSPQARTSVIITDSLELYIYNDSADLYSTFGKRTF